MAAAPTGPDAVRLWDAIQVLSAHEGFFEITRSRTNPPRLHLPGERTKGAAILGA
jgi:hypothetical protein